MSGNASQRKQARDLKELVELGRQQKESIEAHQARIAAKEEEIAALRARLEASATESARRGEEIIAAGTTIAELRDTLKRFDENSSSEVARLQGELDRADEHIAALDLFVAEA